MSGPDDDRLLGTVLSRREALAALGAAGFSFVAGSAAASRLLQSCVVRPELTEGPYFVDEMLNRADIRVDPADQSVRPGALLDLGFRVTAVAGQTCFPLPGLIVDVWHCDAAGAYSDVANQVGKKFLRGYQATDDDGRATFTTIYPGWYPGRAVHIHFKIRTALAENPDHEFTSQLFFDDALTDAVYTQAPYDARGARSTRNTADSIYNGGGSQLLLETAATGSGYAATLDIALVGLDTRPATWGRVKGRLG